MNFEKCRKCANAGHTYVCSQCGGRFNHFEPIKPKTNADHIRSLSDEKLANTIHAVSLGWKGQTNWCDFHCENPGEDGCDKCIFEWLKQPYKEDT